MSSLYWCLSCPASDSSATSEFRRRWSSSRSSRSWSWPSVSTTSSYLFRLSRQEINNINLYMNFYSPVSTLGVILYTLEPHYNIEFGVHSGIGVITDSVIMRVLCTLSISSGSQASTVLWPNSCYKRLCYLMRLQCAVKYENRITENQILIRSPRRGLINLICQELSRLLW